MKELDHSKPYYKGLGNTDYSECLDVIAKMWKYCFLGVLYLFGVFLISCLFVANDNVGMSWILGTYLGCGFYFITDCLSVKKKYKLRIEEIKGE